MTETETETDTGPSSFYLTGQLLIAMPSMMDTRFEKTVIYMCSHTKDGAMGLVVNRSLDNLSFPDLLEQLGIADPGKNALITIHFGGPVEAERGFVLHSSDYKHETTISVDDEVALTATVDILKDIATGSGPQQCLLALGYAGWSPGQLDMEIKANGWLHVAADESLVFGPNLGCKWEQSIEKLGIDINMLSGVAGHA